MIEVLKQALEALEVANSCIDGYYLPKEKAWLPEIEEAMTSLRQVIAEAEKQEQCKTCKGKLCIGEGTKDDPIRSCPSCNTKAPQRTWVNLTDEEIQAVLDKPEPFYDTMFWFARTIERKLKKKNA